MKLFAPTGSRQTKHAAGRRLRPTFLLVACVLAGLLQTPVHAQPAPSGNTSMTDKIVFPTFHFQGSAVGELLGFLRAKTRDLLPKGQTLSFVVGEGVIDTAARVAINAENITLTEALELLSRITRADVRVLDDEVFLTKSTTKKPPYPNGAITEVLRRQGQAQFPGVPFHKATLPEAVAFARVKGKDLDPQHQHVNIAIDPALISVNATDQLERASLHLVRVAVVDRRPS